MRSKVPCRDSTPPRRANYRRSWRGRQTPWRRTSAASAAVRKRAIKDFWRPYTQDVVQQCKAVRKVIEVQAPGPSRLWNLLIPNTCTLLTEAHDVMAAVRAFWQKLYGKLPVDLPSF